MKRLLLLFLSAISLCAEPVVSLLQPSSPTFDTYPITTTRYQIGGWMNWMTNVSQLTNTVVSTGGLPTQRRFSGMVSTIGNASYQLDATLTNWTVVDTTVNSVADLLLVPPSTTGGSVNVLGYYTPGDGGGGIYTLTNSVANTNGLGGRILAIGGSSSWTLAQSGQYSVLQFGAVPAFLNYYTNNGNAVQIPTDSTTAFQAATDFVTGIGGGVVYIPAGDYKISTVYGKPHVAYLGAAPVTGFQGNAQDPSDGFQARLAGQTAIHGTSETSNGLGIPLFILDGPTYYTNEAHASFTSLDLDVLTYYSGNNSFDSITFMPGYKWAWNGGYPTAGIIINQVDGTTIQNCNFQTIAGVGIYILAGRGTIVRDNLLRGCVIAGTFVSNTSDALFEGNVYNNASANFMSHQANTIEFKRNAAWNTREDLVRYTGAITMMTEFGQSRGFATPRTNWLADATTDIVSVDAGIGADTGIPIVFRGTSLPGGLNTNQVYYPRFSTGSTTSWYLTTSAYKAFFATNIVDITSSGGTNTWWCETLSGSVSAWDAEEIFVRENRFDQNWDMSVSFNGIRRGTVTGNEIWEIGIDQTVTRFNTRSTNQFVRGILLVNCGDVLVANNELLGTFYTSSVAYPLVFDYSGVDIYNSGNIQVAGNQADWLDQLVNVDAVSTGITVSGGTGLFANQLIKSANPSVPSRFNGADFQGTNWIWATIPDAYTNVSGDFCFSLNMRMPEAQADNTYMPMFLLGSTTNAVGSPGAVTEYGLACFGYMSTTNCLIFLRHYGSTLTNFIEQRYTATEWCGKSIRLTFQRTNGFGEIWIDGVKMAASTVTGGVPPAESDPIYAPYVLLGPWTFNLYATNRIYHFAGNIGQSFGYQDVDKGAGFQQRGSLVWDWDFARANNLTVPDGSGNGVDGIVVNIDPNDPIVFGNYSESQFALNPGTRGQVLLSNGADIAGSFYDSYADLTYVMRALGSTIIAQPVGTTMILASSPQVLTSGQVRVSAVRIPQETTITGITFWQRTTGSYTANNNNKVGLYSISNGTLTLVASSTDDGNLWKAGTTSLTKKAFTTPYVAQPGVYYAAAIYCQSAQVTQPQISMGSLVSAVQGEMDLANSAKLYALLAGQTDLPATIAMSTMTVAGSNIPWLAPY